MAHLLVRIGCGTTTLGVLAGGFQGSGGKIGGLLGGTNRFEVMKKRFQKMINHNVLKKRNLSLGKYKLVNYFNLQPDAPV